MYEPLPSLPIFVDDAGERSQHFFERRFADGQHPNLNGRTNKYQNIVRYSRIKPFKALYIYNVHVYEYVCMFK